MPEISHQKLAGLINQPKKIQGISLFLLHGEEYLYKKAMQKILELLLPGNQRQHNCIVVDGGNEGIARALTELDTFSFLNNRKVVVVNDAKIFNGEQDKEGVVVKIQKALADDKLKNAAQFFLKFLTNAGYTLDDLNPEFRGKPTSTVLAPFSDQDAVKRLVQYCREKKMKPPNYKDEGDILQRSIEKGFVDNHYLIIAVDTVDRRRKLFKVIKDNGLVVDCSVPKGEKRADKQAQNAVLKEALSTILSSSGKSMEPAAFQTLCDLTGFDLRLFSQNMEKLVDYVGKNPVIRTADVSAVVQRSRQDPIYAFTNAILDRNTQEALFLLNSLLHQEMHPLQVLTAMVNQFRKLLLAKNFVLTEQGKCWVKGGSYGHFTANVFSAIENYDKEVTTIISSWHEMINQKNDDSVTNSNKKKKNRKTTTATDLRIIKNKNSPYPVYQLFLRTDSFSIEDIMASLEKLSQADYNLKTSPRSPKLILEDVILFICKPT
jgi:DNA polymerase-3 subunit delta